MFVNGAKTKGWTFYVDSESDIEKLPTNTKPGNNGVSEEDNTPCPIGSSAIVAETGAGYILFPNGTWVEV
ncbi:MAG: hypothetical protein MJ176_03325 [Treponema sp.]|nr:hypothetical protein [Treponema sp.]